ncbi:MAG: T9SS type A sorting domain-containing protein [Bacteroidales bacterium]|nr:T9SS type A sorting domain-containing protein [Bacteroidales bacterium]
MRKHIILLLFFFTLVFQGMTQWYWEYPIPQGNPINDLHLLDETGYAVGNYGSLLKTIDNSSSWVLIDSVTVNELTSVYIAQQNYAHVVGDFGTILQTTNGEDWNTMKSGTHYKLNGVSSTPTASKSFAVGYKGIILKTELDWEDWEEISSPTLFTLYAIDFATDQVGVIVGDSGTILRTDNGGESWNKLSAGLIQPLLDIHFPTETTGYLVGNQGTIMKTTDAGASWSDLSFVQVENNLNSVYFGDELSGCAVGATGVVITTLDGGVTWEYYFTSNELQFLASHYQKVQNDTICDTILVAGANGIILKTDSCGVTWQNTTYSSAYTLNDIIFPENNNGYAVGGDPFDDIPYMLRYSDTASWQVYKVDTITHYMTEIYFLNPDVGYISGRKGSIYKTSDKGTSWTPLESGVNETLYSIFFLNNQLGFAAGTNGTLIKTTSGDTTWTELNTGTTNNLYSLYLSSSNNGGYVVGEEGTVLKIKNGGNEISPVVSGTTVSLYDVFVKSDTVAFTVGFSGKIFKIRNVFGKDTVISIHSGVTTPLNNIYFTNNTTGYIAGEGGVMLKTTDGGFTWYPQYTGTNNNLRGLTFIDQSSGYTVGSGGTILKTTNGGGGVILPSVAEIKTTDYNMHIYPNPVSNYTWIAWELSDRSDVQISLYDLSGREVKKILTTRQLQGKQKVKMDAASIPAGIYLVVLKVNDRLTSKKLIIY